MHFKLRPLFSSIVIIVILFGGCGLLKLCRFGFIYQVTHSMPEGVYMTYYPFSIKRNDNVVFVPNAKTEHFIVSRGWLPANVPLLKKVVGVPGDYLCIKDETVYINQVKVATIYQKDRQGNPLPIFNYCGKINQNKYFMQGVANPYSFDSRYYGLVSKKQIISKAVQL